MNILGIIYHPDFGHPAACLMRDGKLDCFVEEERLARVKQARGMFPGRAIAFCLKHGGLRLADVDRIAFGWDANYYRTTFPFFVLGAALKYRLFESIPKKGSGLMAGRKDLGSGLIPGLKDLLNYNSKNLDQEIAFGLGEAGFVGEKVPPVVYVKHHLAHAASAFYSSGFKEAAVLVFDGHGEQNTTTIYKGRDRELTLLKEINVPHSLGWVYSAFTEYLGWDPNEGEVKLMGLAPFGRPNPELKRLMDDIVRISADDIKIDTDYIFYGKRSYGRFYSDRVVARLGAPRNKTEALTQHHKDIAFAVQAKLEEAGVFLAKKAVALAGSGNLCLAGGVALNCKMNGEIHRSGVADTLFVQPISHDAGVALGA
ncbi:MAG: hypothetical protein HY343_01050, partial [Lentisphaerae bacterium]|nr:hypothetical protein [Lentisphaerota bacterium]